MFMIRKRKTEDLKPGENLLQFSNKSEDDDNISHVEASKSGGHKTGNFGVVYDRGVKDYTVIHESLHLLGLSDRYDEPEELKPGTTNEYRRPNELHDGFTGDVMGSYGSSTLNPYHYMLIKMYGEKSSGPPQPRNDMIDLNGAGRLLTPYEPGGVHTDKGQQDLSN